MNSEKLKKEWVELSTPWIKEAREGLNPTRNGLLDPPMLQACGDVTGLRVLDAGCGEGRFCRILSDRGASKVLGLDLCEPMIRSARQLPREGVSYQIADVQQLDFLPPGSFDLAISYLNQCDLPEFRKNNQEIFRVLKKGGRFIIANLHPMRSASGMWQKNEKGEKEHVILDRYFEEEDRYWKIMGVLITNFHRTLATYINSFIEDGFTLEGLMEPTVTPENLKRFPKLDDELRVPNFIIYQLKKA